VSPEVEVYEVELVKNNVGLGITIAGYISDKPHGTLLHFTIASSLSSSSSSFVIVITYRHQQQHHHHQVICSVSVT